MHLCIQSCNPDFKSWFRVPDAHPKSIYDLKEALCLCLEDLKSPETQWQGFYPAVE